MNARFSYLVAAVLTGAVTVRGAESFEAAMAHATQDYTERLQRASEELNRTRAQIADEKAPLLRAMRAAEDRIIAAEADATRLDTAQAEAGGRRRELLKALDQIRKQTGYMATLAHDSLKAFGDTLPPGQDQLLGEKLQGMQQAFDDTTAGPSGRAATDVADFLFEQTERAVGGYTARGSALAADTNQVLHGTFAFVGPETFFQPAGGPAGSVRLRPGASLPVTYALPEWDADAATAFFSGRPGAIVADASGGKALRLKETTGTVWDHIRKGGVMALIIIAVGVVSLLMILGKVRDLRRMKVDSPARVREYLRSVSAGSFDTAKQELGELKSTTAELFAVGLEFSDQPKAILEEHLQAVLLGQRLHYERRLPLLAVIATAAPLMGLLGTVTGMVKTFALITVFGTGNAGKLSSGISEVLVATELGLIVAIPTLVAHGFLAHRIQKNLALLERHALQFVTAVDTARAAARAADNREPVPA